MGADQTRQQLNRLDSEIASLEKKSADLGKKEANARSNAIRTKQSISKNASLSTLRSKQTQIDRYNDEATKAAHSKADNDKKIADKRKKRADTAVKLQREEAAEKKKNDNVQKNIRQDYERRINELTSQLTREVHSSVDSGHQKTRNEQENVEFDVFISHASEDKENFVDNLVQELKKRAINVWYDAISIEWGDNLRAKIDAGISKSRYGIVVLSKDYIKKYWTQQELEGLFQRESTDKKVILPIWHNITKDEVKEFSPMLASRKALNSATFSTEEIADELQALLSVTENPDNVRITENTAND